MRATKNTKNRPNKTLSIVLVSVLVVVLLAGYGFAAYSQSWWPFQAKNPSDASKSVNETSSDNASDPTYSSDKTEDEPEDTTSNPNTSPSDPESKVSVQVGISSASKEGDQLEIRAFATGAIEGSGTCTATASQGSSTVSATSKAFIDVSTTQCEPIQIDLSKLKPGTWSVVVTYSSATHQGTSSAMEVVL